MTVLIDHPLVPSRGRLWSHLASDTSFAELHEFAGRVGIPGKGFDRDHYDVPAERYDDMIAAGARPVRSRELVAALRRAGLRTRRPPPAAEDERPPISLADPSVIRALSHPARVVVIDELFSGRVATSTQLARLAGLTPSAMSYHLRSMAKLGIVERDESGTDGRERPWRACGSGITLTQPTSRAQLVASAMLVSTVMQGQLQAFERYVEVEPTLPPEWQSLATLTSYVETLTATEIGSLTDELGAVIDRYRGRSADRPGVNRVRLGVTVVPSIAADGAELPIDPGPGADD